MNDTYNFTLHIPDEITKLMEERFILVSDIEKVIDHSIEQKERFFNPKTSDFLAHLRLQNVTYWVKYQENGRKITVTDVYSHRMEVMEGQNGK